MALKRCGLLLALILIGGCAQTSTVPTTTLAPLPLPPTTTLPATTTTPPDIITRVMNVPDGQSFDARPDGPSTASQHFVIPHIAVPAISTCEGIAARNLLGSIVFGHPVQIKPDGTVYLGSTDIGLALINSGVAKATDAVYAANDNSSVDATCPAETSIVFDALPAAPPSIQPKPKTTKPTTTQPKTTAAPKTTTSATTEPQATKPKATAAATTTTAAATTAKAPVTKAPVTRAPTTNPPAATDPAKTPPVAAPPTHTDPVTTPPPTSPPPAQTSTSEATKPSKPSKPPKKDPPQSG